MVANSKAQGSFAQVFTLATLAWAIAVFLALRIGAVEGLGLDLILQLRLPRVILAGAVGMSLAVAGAALQSLFANPLCEPYTLGISSGAALGAVLGSSYGLGWIIAGVAGAAVLGALFFAVVLYAIAHRPGVSNLSLLLSGVMLGFVGSSLVTVWMALADIQGVQGTIFWLLGDLSRARLNSACMIFGLSTFLIYVLWRQRRSLDALLLGEEGARCVGVDVSSARKQVILISSLLVGLAVSASGMIGFIGLVIPMIVRRWVGSLHLKLIPLAAVTGACALTVADLAARALVQPYELPVGAVTALLGAPAFLWIMLKQRSA
jgi:iron complex transport system permease protein